MQDSVIGEVFANEQFKGRGLVARMLFCKPQSTVGRREFDTTPVAPETAQAYEDAVFALLEHPDTGDLLHLSIEAQAVSREWFQRLEPMHVDELADMGDWSGKLHGATLRIAGLLHCMEHWDDLGHNLIVSGRTMKNAVEIGAYLLEHAKWAYLTMGADMRTAEAKYVLKKIEALGKPVFPLRDIMRKCRKGSLGSVEKITPALTLLEEHGYIKSFEQRPTQGKGKPNVFYEVNPCVTHVTAETDP